MKKLALTFLGVALLAGCSAVQPPLPPPAQALRPAAWPEPT